MLANNRLLAFMIEMNAAITSRTPITREMVMAIGWSTDVGSSFDEVVSKILDYFRWEFQLKHEETLMSLCKNAFLLKCLFCLFGVYCSTRVFFTHIEMSPLPVKGFKF